MSSAGVGRALKAFLKGPSGPGGELAVRGWLPGELEAFWKVAEGSFGARKLLEGSWKSSWLGSAVNLIRV
jgi:hypothetical protein